MKIVVQPEKMAVAELLAVLAVFAKDLPRTFHEDPEQHAALWSDIKAVVAELERRYPVADQLPAGETTSA